MSRAHTHPHLQSVFIFKGLMPLLFALLMPLFASGQNLHIILPNVAICTGGSVTLAPQVSGGTPPYSFVWSPATSLSCANCANPEASPAQTTTYSLIVSDNTGGVATAFVIVTVAPSPAPNISPATQTVCTGGPAALTFNSNGGAGACNIVWESSPNGNDGWTTISGANASLYNPPTTTAGITYYRARYACTSSGCGSATSAAVSVTVSSDPAPIVSVSPANTATCVGNPVTLTVNISGSTGNCTIQWQRASPWTNIAGATGMSYTPLVTTTGTNFYRAVVTCPDGSCAGTLISNQVPVAGLGNPAVSISPTTGKTVCIGGVARLTATTNGASIFCPLLWYAAENANGPWTLIPGATGSTFMAPTTGLGTMYYTASPECFNGACPQPASNVVPVTVTDHVAPNITLIPQNPFCNGQPGSVRAIITGTGDNYTINSLNGAVGAQGATTGTPVNLTPFPPGLQCFTVSGNNGCAATEACTTLEAAPALITISPIITPASCTSTPNGSIALPVSGGVPPYQYLWSNGSTSGVLSNLPAGTYGLTLSDANGCFQMRTFTVNSALTVNAGPDQVLDCNIAEMVLQGSASHSGANINYTWYAPDGSIIGSQTSITVSQGGLYRFRATDLDINGCFSEDQVEVIDVRSSIPDGMNAMLTACNTWLLSPIVPAGYNGPMAFEWTRPDGNISTDRQITATQTGVYQLRTTIPGSGCESVISRYIDADDAACATVSGRIVYETNENCNPETNEAGLSGWIVQATGSAGAFHAITDANGNYHFSLPLGNYVLSAMPPSASWVLCVSSYAVQLNVTGQMYMLDIPAQFVVLCPELEVQLSAPSLRRCFPNYYTVRVCNTGTETVQSPRVSLVLDDFLEFLTAQYAPESVNGQTIAWTLPALAPGQCRQFWVQILVNCDAALGQAHCSTVMVTPDSLCTPASPAWSGASLEVSGECTGEEVLFRVRNAGSGDLTDPVQYIVIEDVVMLMHQPATIDGLESGGERVFEFPANGSTYLFSVQQAAHHPFGNTVTAALEGCGTNDSGTFSTGFMNQLPLQTATPATFTLCMPNIGAYDPNDKQAIPIGYGPEHFIRAGDPLQYKIRFQNTGTDTAFTVIIRDALSPWLDISTLRPGPSSHPYRLDIAGERSLVFTFDNILLPDSTTHLEASQGFVDFFIRTADTIPLLTRIENSAAIYFDFNEPVITNTVFHTIGTDFIRSATAVFQPHPGYKWQLFPNPATDEAWLISDAALPGRKTVWMYDALGRLLRQVPFEGERCLLHFKGLAPGWYALRVTDAAGRGVGAARVLKR